MNTWSLIENVLKRFDEIVVLKNGKVHEQGRFDDLMEKKGFFYSLYELS